jgi:hypothetical protein
VPHLIISQALRRHNWLANVASHEGARDAQHETTLLAGSKTGLSVTSATALAFTGKGSFSTKAK